MAKKRKDKKGRVLRTGESQRKDLIYQYRFTDTDGTRRAVYASTLDELRKKETEIESALNKNIVFYSQNITVLELVKQYLSLKVNLRPNTLKIINQIVNSNSKEKFFQRPICQVKTSEVKKWYIQLHDEKGKKRGTIGTIHSLLRQSFQMAYEEDVIEKNPFNFSLTFLPNDAEKRQALTPQQQTSLLEFMQTDAISRRYYDIYIILLWTGLRASELCGLTIHDLDFNNRLIHVDHQLFYDGRGNYAIGPTKTKSGVRIIPMTDDVYNAFKRLLERRNIKTELFIDGKTGFIFLNNQGKPRYVNELNKTTMRIMKRYNAAHPDSQLHHVTPHVFRHTFCTNMVNAGMPIKDIQYIMGHSSIDITMNLYSHVNAEHAVGEMKNVVYKLQQDETAMQLKEQHIF